VPNISQRTEVTGLMCGQIFNDDFITNYCPVQWLNHAGSWAWQLLTSEMQH